MKITECFEASKFLLMEGALGERLKREYHLSFDGQVAMARLCTTPKGAAALDALWSEYAAIAADHRLPFLATTPTRRANRERVSLGRGSKDLIAENVRHLRAVLSRCQTPAYAGGLMGCKGDAYTGEGALSAEDAQSFHAWQAEEFAKSGADFLFAGIGVQDQIDADDERDYRAADIQGNHAEGEIRKPAADKDRSHACNGLSVAEGHAVKYALEHTKEDQQCQHDEQNHADGHGITSLS